MTLSIRQIKSRIRGIQNVNKLTHAMEMISISKLRPAQNQLIASRQYFLKIDALLKNLLSDDSRTIVHPLIEERPVKQKIAICLITSDTGLCGNYNRNIIRLAEEAMNKYEKEKILLFAVGRKGLNYFRKRGVKILQSYTELNGRYSDEITDKILKHLLDIFLSKEVDEVFIAYTYLESASRHRSLIEKLLNIPQPPESSAGFILEPDINSVLGELIPVYLFNKLKFAILNAFTSEHSARAIAMGEATENAKELLENLVLLRNKLRQANITKEIMEIVSSAEVLR